MMNLWKRWTKIYLFYGVAFFLLGLFGCLASDQVKLTAWSARQMQNINHLWSLFTLSGQEEPLVPAYGSQSDKIIVQVYLANPNRLLFETLLQQLRSKLQQYFQQVIITPVDDLHSLMMMEPIEPTAPSILIGYKYSPNSHQDGSDMQNSLYFSMPDPASDLFASKFLQAMSAKLPAYRFSKQLSSNRMIYQFDWNGSGEGDNLSNEIISTFIRAMDPDVIKLLNRLKLE
jgi:hypothetical protein